jgi:hypothetical protein
VVEDIPARGYDARPMINRAHDQPLCPEGDFRFWAGVGASALLVYSLGCLAGASALMPGIPGDAAIIQRLSAAGAAVVWIILCTAAGSLAFAALSLVRGRPAGSAFDIASRTFACVAVAMLAHFVPVGHGALKTAFDGASFAVASALLARSAFRVASLDAFAATSIATGIVGALAAAAFVVDWAVRPG